MRLIQVTHDLSHLELIAALELNILLKLWPHVVPQLELQSFHIDLFSNCKGIELYFLISAAESIEPVARVYAEHVFQIVDDRLLCQWTL